MKENKKFKSFRSELTESEYSEVIMGQPNTSAHTDFGTHRIDYPKVMANINAMLSVISKTSSVDPMEAFNKIRCRLNIVMLDFDFNIFRNWNQGVGSFVVPVTRFGRVDGYDAMTGQVRFDGKANNPDGFKELSMVVTVDLDADSLYVVSAKLYASDELQTTDAVDSVKEGTGYSDEEVKSGKQRSGRPYPEAKFPGWKVGKNMQTQKVKNGKKIGGATSKELDAEKIMDYRAAQKFYEKDMPNQILRARLEDRKRTAAKNSVKEDVEQVDELSKGLLKRYKAAATVNADNLEKEGDYYARHLQGKMKDAEMGKRDPVTPKEKKLSMKIRDRMHKKSDARREKIGQAERKLGEETEQIDELSKKTKDAYVAKRGSQLSSMMYGSGKNYNSLTGKKQANAVKGIKKAMGVKEDVEQVDEAGQAKLYRMRYSHGRAWRRGDKKKQDAMGVATYDKQKKEDAKDLNRTGSAFGMRVKRLAGNRKAMGYSESTLIGKQKKLDANNNKRLDSQDFKLLRSKKSVKEELIGKQKKLDVNKNKRLDAEDFKALRAKRTMTDR